MGRTEEMLELLLIVAHRARLAFEEGCQFEEYVPHEVLLLRALVRAGQGKTGREVAKATGWSAGRVSQVVDELVKKEHVIRAKRLSVTGRGAGEAEGGGHVLRHVADSLLVGLEEVARDRLRELLQVLAQNSEGLERVKRNVYG